MEKSNPILFTKKSLKELNNEAIGTTQNRLKILKDLSNMVQSQADRAQSLFFDDFKKSGIKFSKKEEKKVDESLAKSKEQTEEYLNKYKIDLTPTIASKIQYDIDQIFGKIFERTIAKEMCKNKMTGLIDRSHVMKTQTIVKNFYQKVSWMSNEKLQRPKTEDDKFVITPTSSSSSSSRLELPKLEIPSALNQINEEDENQNQFYDIDKMKSETLLLLLKQSASLCFTFEGEEIKKQMEVCLHNCSQPHIYQNIIKKGL